MVHPEQRVEPLNPEQVSLEIIFQLKLRKRRFEVRIGARLSVWLSHCVLFRCDECPILPGLADLPDFFGPIVTGEWR
jgi:hypothetical protein